MRVGSGNRRTIWLRNTVSTVAELNLSGGGASVTVTDSLRAPTVSVTFTVTSPVTGTGTFCCANLAKPCISTVRVYRPGGTRSKM